MNSWILSLDFTVHGGRSELPSIAALPPSFNLLYGIPNVAIASFLGTAGSIATEIQLWTFTIQDLDNFKSQSDCRAFTICNLHSVSSNRPSYIGRTTNDNENVYVTERRSWPRPPSLLRFRVYSNIKSATRQSNNIV